MMTCTGWNAQGQPHANASMLLIVAVNWMIQCHPQHPRQEELSLADLYSKQACPAEALADSVPGTKRELAPHLVTRIKLCQTKAQSLQCACRLIHPLRLCVEEIHQGDIVCQWLHTYLISVE